MPKIKFMNMQSKQNDERAIKQRFSQTTNDDICHRVVNLLKLAVPRESRATQIYNAPLKLDSELKHSN